MISGNEVTGLVIGDLTSALTPAAMGNLVQGNFIGINATDDTPLPNGGGDFDRDRCKIQSSHLGGHGRSNRM